MIRLLVILIFFLLISLYTLFAMIINFVLEKFDKSKVKTHSMKFVKFVLKTIVYIAGVKIYVNGIENIRFLDNEKSYFAISNHRGYFDIITGYLLFEKNTGIIAKNSLEKIPVISYWMKKIDCIFLDRKNLRNGVMMVIKAIENINNGISMWIFPEGTRSKNKEPVDMLEFKGGAFKIPEKTDCFILPISFRNTEKVFENQAPFLKPTDVYINIGKPYKISELDEESKNSIAEYSQSVIKKLLTEDIKWQKL